MRVAGVIENMSHLVCSCCGEVTHPFGQGGGQELADELGVPLLGQVPLDERLRVTADEGVPLVLAEPENATAKAVRELAVAVPECCARAAAPSASRSRSPSSDQTLVSCSAAENLQHRRIDATAVRPHPLLQVLDAGVGIERVEAAIREQA